MLQFYIRKDLKINISSLSLQTSSSRDKVTTLGLLAISWEIIYQTIFKFSGIINKIISIRIIHENNKKWITKEQILLKKIDTILDILLHLRMPKKKIQKLLFEFIQDK